MWTEGIMGKFCDLGEQEEVVGVGELVFPGMG